LPRLKDISRGHIATDTGHCLFYSIPEEQLDDVAWEMFDRHHPAKLLH